MAGSLLEEVVDSQTLDAIQNMTSLIGLMYKLPRNAENAAKIAMADATSMVVDDILEWQEPILGLQLAPAPSPEPPPFQPCSSSRGFQHEEGVCDRGKSKAKKRSRTKPKS